MVTVLRLQMVRSYIETYGNAPRQGDLCLRKMLCAVATRIQWIAKVIGSTKQYTIEVTNVLDPSVLLPLQQSLRKRSHMRIIGSRDPLSDLVFVISSHCRVFFPTGSLYRKYEVSEATLLTGSVPVDCLQYVRLLARA